MLARLGTGLGERLGAGRFSEVFAWDPESVVKLFYPGFLPGGIGVACQSWLGCREGPVDEVTQRGAKHLAGWHA